MSDETRPVLRDNGHLEGRTAKQIEADLAETRERLAATVDTLVERVQPREIASRSAAQARLVVMTPDGRLRVGRLVVVAVSAAAVFGALRLLRRRVRREP